MGAPLQPPSRKGRKGSQSQGYEVVEVLALGSSLPFPCRSPSNNRAQEIELSAEKEF